MNCSHDLRKSYSQYRSLPERERWEIYGSAKRHPQAMLDAGLILPKEYHQFIDRITREMGI